MNYQKEEKHLLKKINEFASDDTSFDWVEIKIEEYIVEKYFNWIQTEEEIEEMQKQVQVLIKKYINIRREYD